METKRKRKGDILLFPVVGLSTVGLVEKVECPPFHALKRMPELEGARCSQDTVAVSNTVYFDAVSYVRSDELNALLAESK